MKGELVVTEIDESLLPKLKKSEEKKAHLDSLDFWEQELYQDTKEDYAKFSRVIRIYIYHRCMAHCIGYVM